MWVNAGCMAVFQCDDEVNVTCQSHENPKLGPLFRVCNCVSDPNPPHPGPHPGPPLPPPQAPIPKCAGRPGGVCPNIVFIIDESTDGRTYRSDGFAPTVIPNIRKLADEGVQFDTRQSHMSGAHARTPISPPPTLSLGLARLCHAFPQCTREHQRYSIPLLSAH